MGAADSKLAGTDWETADGGMRDSDVCLAGNTPTHGHKTIVLQKKHLMKNRQYKIKDAEGKVLLECRETPVSVQWFDLTTPAEHNHWQDLARCCKQHSLSNTWTIASFKSPAFEGQEPDKNCHLANEFIHEEQRPLYPHYQIQYDSSKKHATIQRYEKDALNEKKSGVPAPEAVLALEKINPEKGKHDHYQVYRPEEPNTLVAYWEWKNTATDHKMELQVAKGVDLALQCMLAILVNLVKATEKFPFVGLAEGG